MVALLYALSGAILFLCAKAGTRERGRRSRAPALAEIRAALRSPTLIRLAPAWLCINAIVGVTLWSFVIGRMCNTSVLHIALT